MRDDTIRKMLLAAFLGALLLSMCRLGTSLVLADSDSLPIVPEPTLVHGSAGTIPPAPSPEFDPPPIPTLIPTPVPPTPPASRNVYLIWLSP